VPTHQAFQVTICDHTIMVHGDVDLATTDRLGDAITRVAEGSGRHTVVVDLAGLTFLDSSGIQGLVISHQTLAAAGIELVLRNVPEPAHLTLSVAGVAEYLNVTQSNEPESSWSSAILPAMA
jgi:anti-sigma B factor antagonist